MPKIIRKLDKSHIRDLEAMSENSPFGEKFWQIVENSLSAYRPLYHLYECECGSVFILKKNEFNKLKKKKVSKCFHDVLLNYSDSIQDAVTSSKIKKASKLLKDKKVSEAISSCLGLLPSDSFESFDYGLWQLQLCELLHRYYEAEAQEKRFLYQQQYIKESIKLFNRAKKQNPKELKKLLKHIWSKTYQAEHNEKLFNALSKKIESSDIFEKAAYIRVTKSYIPDNQPSRSHDELVKRSVQLHLDAYQAYFEISEIYFFLANLIEIINGNRFSTTPFSNKFVLVNGKRKTVGESKGYQVVWIVKRLNKNLGKKVRLALNNQLRNDTSGHNDYIVDVKNKRVCTTSKKKTYSFSQIRDNFSRLKALSDSLIVVGQLAQYEDECKLPQEGIYAWSMHYDPKTKKPLNKLTIYQFWSNAETDLPGNHFNLAKFKFDTKTNLIRARFSVRNIGKPIVIPPTNNSVTWLENLARKGSLKITRFGIAPRTTYFRDRAVALYDDDGPFKFYVLGNTDHKLPVKTKHLISVIKKIKKYAKMNQNIEYIDLNKIIKPIKNHSTKKLHTGRKVASSGQRLKRK